MHVLIVKLGATGDVVRTTVLLRQFDGPITWLTAAKNLEMLPKQTENLRPLSWEQRDLVRDRKYDLIINLEDDLETSLFLETISASHRFGAYADGGRLVRYTDDARRWFDLSLISVHGRQEADRLKLLNRRSYQDLLFEGLGLVFRGEPYVLPEPSSTSLAGDVAMAPEAGAAWPMKNWAYYRPLRELLENRGFTVNVLPVRRSLLEHLADVRNHRCLVSGDSLPMHLALGSSVPCVSLFTCTSPWEIHGYGLQRQIISPLLAEFFYKRDFEPRATTAITVQEVFDAVLDALRGGA